jgi:glyoxylase-like metal-dependent hydrolase (beta-lactamase superfamily II)
MQRHKIALPRRIQLIFADRLQEDLRIDETRLGAPPAQLFATPAGYAVPPAPGQPNARRLAEGLFLFENMPGGYRSAVVDAGDHLMLLEAPLSPAYAAAQDAILDRLFPGKPVRYVFVTHHHGDHTAGLPHWLEQGATIIAPQGARAALERQLRARGIQPPFRIEEVADRQSFGSGAARVDAHSFASDHAASHLLMSIPSARAVFQGDLFYVPDRGQVPPAFPIVQDFKRQLVRAGLSPDLIIGVHGRPATGAELRVSEQVIVQSTDPVTRTD